MVMSDWWRTKASEFRRERQKRRSYALGVEALIDRVDPGLRGLSGYRERLIPALKQGVATTEALIDSLPAPLTASREGWVDSRRLRVYFATPQQMHEALGESRMVRDFLTSATGSNVTEVYAAISMRMDRKTRFGTALDGDRLLSDQRQESIDFSDLRVGALAGDEDTFRKALRHRILEEVTARAIQRILGSRMRRDAMTEQKTLLQWKLKMYEMRQSGVGTLWHDQAAYQRHIDELKNELGAVSEGLDELVERAGDIADFLEMLATEFEQVEHTVKLESSSFYLDDMNIEMPPERGGKRLELATFRVGKRRPRVFDLIRFSPDDVSVDTGRALRRAARELGVGY